MMINKFTANIYDHSPVWAQNLFCTFYGKKLQKQRFSGGFERWGEFYAESRNWSESDLREYQREKLGELIRHCFESVPFYANSWEKRGLSPADFSTLDDLKKFPKTTKEDLFECGEEIISRTVNRKKLVKWMTGGSTGMPLPCFYTPGEIRQHFAIFWDRMRQGVKRGDYYATFYGKEIVPSSQKNPPYWRENRAANQRLYSMNHLSDEKLEYYAENLINTPFVYYQGYVSILSVVAAFMAERNLKPEIPPRAVFTTSEQLTGKARKLMEETWQTRVWDEYCQGEHCAMIQECEFGNHHVQMDYGVVEYEPISREGEFLLAEIICTGLIPYAAPRIRYRVGDRVLIDERAVCQCGRPGPVIKSIRGRMGDVIITPDGRKYPHISLIVDLLRNVHQTQVVQEESNGITVRIIPSPDYNEGDEKYLISCFKDRIGGGIGVNVEYIQALERLENGKVPSIINRLEGFGGSAPDQMED
jgi:phenylacetate-CoA ligase